MTIDQIEELIRRFIAAGATVIVVLVAPGTTTSVPDGTPVVTMSPTTTPRSTPTTTRAAPPTTGANGSDPGATSTPPASASTVTTAPVSPYRTAPTGTTTSNPTSGPTGGNPTTTTTDRSEPTSTTTAGPSSTTSTSTTSTSTTSTSTTSTTATSTTAATRESAGGTTAASTFGWGTPNREDDFTGSGLDQWSVYNGPGHGGQGTRSPSAASVADGVLTITGDASGTTAGMAWNPGQKYGRWEGRVRAPAADPSYNALLLLWPDAENWPAGGELDFMEMTDPQRQVTNFFLHYGADNSQVTGQVRIDATQWHNWAVEWTPEAITAFVDGRQWYRTTDTSTFPPGAMHLCIQLDWFPEGGTVRESSMQVDWVRQYSLGDGASTGTGTGAENPSPVRALLRSMFSWG